MNEEQKLRDGLEAIIVPPSRIEMAVLVQAGRRRVFRRRSVQAAGGAAMAAAILVAVPSILTRTETPPTVQASVGPASGSADATASPGPCRVTDLPVPAGMENSKAVAVDPTGKYIVGNSTVGQNFRPIMWTDGRPQALPMPPGKSVQVSAVNAKGVVVGLIADAQQMYVIRYENGRYTRLHTPPKSWKPYPAAGINAAGDVVVNVKPLGSTRGTDNIVLLWKAGSTTPVRLPLPAEASAFDITDDGTIIGGTYKDGVADAAYAWDQKGIGRKLELPAGQTGTAYATQGGWVTGGIWPSMSTALWNLQTGKLTMLEPKRSEMTTPKTSRLGVPESGTQGPAVNASGWVVATDGSVLRDGSAVELAQPTGQTSRAAGVSDSGLIVGHTVSHDGSSLGPRMWRCGVPGAIAVTDSGNPASARSADSPGH